MALVNFLKFSSDSGAIISDEEYWNVFFRKRMHGDNLHSLLSERASAVLKMQVVYGSVGYPSIHREVVENTREKIDRLLDGNGAETIVRVKHVGRIAFDYLQEAIRRRIDQKMKLYYGFDTSELTSRQFTVAGETWNIASEPVLKEARKLAGRENRDTLMKAVMDSKAAVFGFDQEGITGYYLSGENSIMGYVHEGFEAIGSGKYASGLVFGSDFKAKTLKMRQDGYEPAQGVFELVNSAFLAGEHFKEVGGNYNFVILNRKASERKDQYRQIFDSEARLITEIVRACKAELLNKKQALLLIDHLVFKNHEFAAVEKNLFEAVSNRSALDLILRGYKTQEVFQLTSDQGDQ